jgi:hypothetical protein
MDVADAPNLAQSIVGPMELDMDCNVAIGTSTQDKYAHQYLGAFNLGVQAKQLPTLVVVATKDITKGDSLLLNSTAVPINIDK